MARLKKNGQTCEKREIQEILWIVHTFLVSTNPIRMQNDAS